MTFVNEIKGFVAKVKEYKMIIISFLGIFGFTGTNVGLWFKESMDRTAAEKIEQHTLPVVKREIYATLDSMMKAKKTSFRQQIADKMRYEKNDVADSLTLWWKSEIGTFHVGIYYDATARKLMYIHTNGKKYRTFYDNEQDLYYFINEQDREEWCK